MDLHTTTSLLVVPGGILVGSNGSVTVTGAPRGVPSESRSYGNPTSINWNAELSTITLIGDVGGAVRLTTFGPGATVKNVAVETTPGGTTMVTPSGVVTVPPSGETSSEVEPPGKGPDRVGGWLGEQAAAAMTHPALIHPRKRGI